jgi:hypothetical protein
MQYCYLCGSKLLKNKNKSKDHVPPDCIYPQEKPANLITVPCCSDCNGAFKQLDQKMRNFFAIIASDTSGELGKKAQSEILRSRKLSSEFLSYTKEHPSLIDDQGKPRLLFHFDKDELSRWLVRVVQGLSFRRNKTRICDTSVYEVEVLSQFKPQPSNTFPPEEGLEFRPHFVYGVVAGETYDFWVLSFYDHLMFSVTVKPPTEQKIAQRGGAPDRRERAPASR